jgi:hypothetical protein
LKIFFFLSFLTLPISSSAVHSQISDPDYFKENIEIYFSFEVKSTDILKTLTNIISIDNVKGNNVYAYANENEYTEFLSFNIEHRILTKPGELFIPEMNDAIDEITDWDTYPTYDGYVSLMNQFAANYPSICQLIDAGNSVQGRSILIAKISDNVLVREDEPQFLYTSTIHGDETTGYVLMLRLIDSLLTSYGSNTRITNLIDNTEIWINPNANPDGTYYGGNNTVYGATRYNANGYDLNRNFPDPVNGVHPDQQQETSVFRTLAENNNFVLCANFHGGTEVVNYPFDTWTNGYPDYVSHADENWYQFISHLYADTCQTYSPSNYMNGYDDGITNGGAWYVIHGGRQDYMNWFMKSREVTIEISDTKLLPTNLLPAHWEYNKRSFLNYIESILFGVRGIITDTIGTPLNAFIKVLNHDTLNSEIRTDSLNGNFHRMLAEGTYTFVFSSPNHFPDTIRGVTVNNFQTTWLNVKLVPEDPVPVELVFFTAEVMKNNVVLKWRTATETNNSGFEIERYRVISKFEIRNLNFEQIGFVKGKGTTTEVQDYTLTDWNVAPGNYVYRLKQIDYNGTFTYSDIVEIEIDPPFEFSLEQNYPNPFNPITEIRYSIPVTLSEVEGSLVTLKVYDILGNEIATLVNEEIPAGSYKVEFNSHSGEVRNLTSGVYFYQLKIYPVNGVAEDYVVTKKMVLLR